MTDVPARIDDLTRSRAQRRSLVVLVAAQVLSGVGLAAGVPIRIGVNAGSLDRRLPAKYGKATPEALVEPALWECSLLEEHGFTDLKISVNHHDPMTVVAAYRRLAAACDYPCTWASRKPAFHRRAPSSPWPPSRSCSAKASAPRSASP